MDGNSWRKRPEWLNESRREPRWIDSRFVVADLGGEEHIGMTGDVSVGGMRVALVGASLPDSDAVSGSVAFEDELVEFRAQIRYAIPTRWGTILGLKREADSHVSEYLAARYAGERDAADAAADPVGIQVQE